MSGPVNSGRVLLFLTPPHPCSYLPGRESTTAFVDPEIHKSVRDYAVLARNGFRRSGEHIYRPHCRDCGACVPVRVPVDGFAPRRSQRRVWRRNADLEVVTGDAGRAAARFELYRRYLEGRHRGGGMDDPTPQQYRDFLTSSWSSTTFHDFLERDRLIAVAVTDALEDGLSAVYTFFDPDRDERSLGVYAILWQIDRARRLGLDWLYLGYWVEGCQKMDYKREYLPQQRLVDGEWHTVRDG